MMTGFWLTLNTISAILPGLLGDPVGLSSTNVTITLVIANVVLAAGYVAAGVISQRTGRRPFLIAIGVVMAAVATFLYYLLISAAPKSLFLVITLTTVITVLIVSPWGLATTYINERFAEIRAEAGLDALLTPHCLRHSYVTHLAEQGWAAKFIQDQVGHSHAATTAIYLSVGDDFKERLVRAAIDELLLELGGRS